METVIEKYHDFRMAVSPPKHSQTIRRPFADHSRWIEKFASKLETHIQSNVMEGVEKLRSMLQGCGISGESCSENILPESGRGEGPKHQERAGSCFLSG